MTAPNATTRHDSLSGRHPPAWRKCELSSEELRALHDEEERTHSFYAAILTYASDKDYPLEKIFGEACRLGLKKEQQPRPEDLAAYTERLHGLTEHEAPTPAQDAYGNPLWITLTLRERHDDGPVVARGVLPSESESAAPHGSLPEKKENSAPGSGPFAAVSRFFKGGTKPEEEAGPYRRKRTVPPKPSALRSFVKMVVLGSCFALLWYVLKAVSS